MEVLTYILHMVFYSTIVASVQQVWSNKPSKLTKVICIAYVLLIVFVLINTFNKFFLV